MPKITIAAQVAALKEDVWRAYTNPKDIVRWQHATSDWHTTRADMDLRVGGKFSSHMEAKDGSAGFDFEGEITQLVENQLIEYSFGERVATVSFLPGSLGVTVQVVFDAETENTIEQQRSGWQAILNNFVKYVENG